MTETKETDGLTHLFEHLFLSSNSLIAGEEAFAKRERELGAVSNATTGQDMLRYFMSYPSVFFEETTEILAAVARTMKLDQKMIDHEIPIVIDELKRALPRSYFPAHLARNHILYGEDLFHRLVPIGTQRKTIENATLETIEKLRFTHFAPENTTMFVLGNVEHGEALKTVKKYFGDWKNPPGWKPPFIPQLPNISKTQRWNFSHPENAHTSLYFLFPSFSAQRYVKETYAADILIFLLENKNSKFYKKFIESGKWLSGSYGMSTASFNPTSYVYLTLKSNTVDQAITDVLAEIKEWSKEGYFSQEDLDRTKKQLTINFKVSGDNLDEFSSSLTYYTKSVGPYYYKNYLDGLQQVTLKDVREYVNQWLVDQPYFLQVSYNTKNAQEWGVDLNGDAYYKKNIAHRYAEEPQKNSEIKATKE